MTKEELVTGLKDIMEELSEHIQVKQKELNRCEDVCRCLQNEVAQSRDTLNTLCKALFALEEKE